MKYEMSAGNKSSARRCPARRQVPPLAISTATSTLMINRYLLPESLSSAWQPWLSLTKSELFIYKYWTNFRCRHALHQHRVMHLRLLLFQPRGDLAWNPFDSFPPSSKSHFWKNLYKPYWLISPFFKLFFLSQAFLGQVLCWTNKHKDCWRRRAKKTGENIRETFKRNKLTKAH